MLTISERLPQPRAPDAHLVLPFEMRSRSRFRARLVGGEEVGVILARGLLEDYYLAHSARADLCRQLGKAAEARASYERALSLARPEPARRFLARRLIELMR